MNCSLVISTYNWPAALDLCLKSVAQQQLLPAEVIIADDGSKQETEALIRQYQSKFPVPLRHVWHPDEGFRLAAIRNKAFAAAETEYVIQIDGDLILHPLFVKDHMDMQRPGYFTAGSRMMLSKQVSQRLLEKGSVDVKKSGASSFDTNGFRNRVLRNFFRERYKTKGKHRFYVKGCNMAFFKKDLVLVNGYNEAFQGWGSEDREIAIRLINAGIKKQFLKNGGICYHLYHATPSRESELRNEALMKEAIEKNTTRAADGLSKYLQA